jgi:hypothetical protein
VLVIPFPETILWEIMNKKMLKLSVWITTLAFALVGTVLGVKKWISYKDTNK